MTNGNDLSIKIGLDFDDLDSNGKALSQALSKLQDSKYNSFTLKLNGIDDASNQLNDLNKSVKNISDNIKGSFSGIQLGELTKALELIKELNGLQKGIKINLINQKGDDLSGIKAALNSEEKVIKEFAKSVGIKYSDELRNSLVGALKGSLDIDNVMNDILKNVKISAEQFVDPNFKKTMLEPFEEVRKYLSDIKTIYVNPVEFDKDELNWMKKQLKGTLNISSNRSTPMHLDMLQANLLNKEGNLAVPSNALQDGHSLLEYLSEMIGQYKELKKVKTGLNTFTSEDIDQQVVRASEKFVDLLEKLENIEKVKEGLTNLNGYKPSEEIKQEVAANKENLDVLKEENLAKERQIELNREKMEQEKSNILNNNGSLIHSETTYSPNSKTGVMEAVSRMDTYKKNLIETETIMSRIKDGEEEIARVIEAEDYSKAQMQVYKQLNVLLDAELKIKKQMISADEEEWKILDKNLKIIEKQYAANEKKLADYRLNDKEQDGLIADKVDINKNILDIEKENKAYEETYKLLKDVYKIKNDIVKNQGKEETVADLDKKLVIAQRDLDIKREKLSLENKEKIKPKESELKSKLSLTQAKVNDGTWAEIEKFQQKQLATLDELRVKYREVFNSDVLLKFEAELKNLDITLDNLDYNKADIKSRISNYANELKRQKGLTNLGDDITGNLNGEVINNLNNLNIKGKQKDFENLAKSIAGTNAEIKKIDIRPVEKNGDTVRTISYRVKEGSDKWHEYKIAIVEAGDTGEKSVRKLDDGVRDVINRQMSFMDKLKTAFQGIGIWGVATNAVYGTIHQVEEGISTINELNKSQTNLMMITNQGKEAVAEYTQQYSTLASQLYDTTTNIMKASEEFLRAGHTQEETLQLMRASTIASKLSGQDQKETADQLIAITNGYKLSMEELMPVIDKMVMTDNTSATSFSEMSEALKRSANSAQLAGVELEKLIAYEATVESVTRKSAESVGESFKTIFARFQNVKGGKKFDPDNEPLSNVERDLNNVGIAIRKNKDEFKDFDAVIQELSAKWNKSVAEGGLTQVEKSTVAKAMAGGQQFNNFLVLMENMDMVNNIMDKMGESAGKAQENFDRAYGQSTEAKINNFKNAMQQLWMSTMNSSAINSAIDGATRFINVLRFIGTESKASGLGIIGLSTSLVLLIKNFKSLTEWSIALKGINMAGFASLIPSVKELGAALLGFATNPVAIAIAAIGALSIAMVKHIKHQNDLKQNTEQLKSTYNDLTSALQNNNSALISTSAESLKGTQSNLQNLLSQKKDLEDKIADLRSDRGGRVKQDDPAYSSLQNQLKKVNSLLSDQTKELKDAGVNFNAVTGEIYKVTDAELRLGNMETVDRIKAHTEYEIGHKEEIIKLAREYNNLSSSQEDNGEKRARLTALSEELKGKIEGLIVTKDEEGHVTIENTELLDKEIDMLNTEGVNVQSLSELKIKTAKDNAQAQIGETAMTYKEISKRLEMYDQESQAWENLKKKIHQSDNVNEALGLQKPRTYNFNTGKFEGGNAIGNLVDSQYEEFERQHQQMLDAKKRLDEIFNNDGKSGGKETDWTPTMDNATESTKENSKAVREAKVAVKEYENALKDLDNVISDIDYDLSTMNDTNNDYIAKLNEKKQAIINEINLTQQAIGVNRENAESLKGLADAYGSVSASSNKLSSSGVLEGSLKGMESTYIKYSNQYGVDPDLAMAIAMAETGKGTSYAVKNQNNPGGIMDWNNNWETVKVFGSLEEGIKFQVKNLYDEYISKGLKTIEQIGGKYAPIGAANDPNGLNKYWIPNVSKFYKQSSGKDTSSLDSGAEDVIGSVESFEKKLIEQKQNLNKVIMDIYNAGKNSFDLDISVAEHKMTMLKTLAEEWGLSKEYMDKAWDVGNSINEKYAALYKKSNYIQGELGSGRYNENQLQTLRKDLYQVQEQMSNTSAELKKFFTEYYDNRYEYATKPIKEDIEVLQETLKYLEEQGDKVSLNNQEKVSGQIVGQTAYQIREQENYLKYLQSQMANEKYESTRLIIKAEIDKVSKDLLKTKEQLIEVTEQNWEIKFKINEQAFDKIKSELEEVQTKMNLLNENDTDYSEEKIDLIEQQIDKTQETLDIYVKQRDELIQARDRVREFPYLWNKLNDKVKEYQKSIDNSTQSIKEQYEAIKQIDEDRLNNLSDIQSKVVEILKRNYELQKKYELDAENGENGRHTLYMKNLEEERNAFEEFVNEKLKALEREDEERDFYKGLKEQENNLAELQMQYNELAMDNSLEAKAKREELSKQIAKAQEDISETQYQRGRELDKQNWNDILDNYKKGIEDKEKEEEEYNKKNTEAIEKKYEELQKAENLYAEASKAIQEDRLEYIEEVTTNINGVINTTLKSSSLSLKEALIKDAQQFGQASGMLKDYIENNLITSINKAIDTAKNLHSIISEINKINGSQYNPNQPSGSGAIKPGSVYAYNDGSENGDYATAKAIYERLGFKIVDTSKLSQEEIAKLQLSNSDIVLGNTLGNIGLNGANRIQGNDRYQTQKMAQDYANNLQVQSTVSSGSDKVVYVAHDNLTDDDYATAQKLLVPNGYRVVDVTNWTDSQKSQISVRENDLVLGNILSNLNVSSKQRIVGDDREDTYKLVKGFIDNQLNNISDDSNKIVDNTGKIVENTRQQHKVLALSEANETSDRPSDYTSAKNILSPLGYDVVDGRGKNHDYVYSTLKAGDIIISPELMSFTQQQIAEFAARGITVINAASDRSIVRKEIEGIASTGIGGSYSEGGVIDFTGLAAVHGSSDRSEVAFNSTQASKLYNWVKNLPNNILELIPKFSLPNMSELQVATSQGVTLQVDNLIRVEGSVDKDVLPSLEDISKKVLGDIQKTFNKAGYFRRV